MKTDRELLELAARALGGSIFTGLEGVCLCTKPNSSRLWNPLQVDGDAFRLAVELGIEYCYGYGLDGEVQRVIVDDDLHVMVQGGDAAAATRRAITRAAAQIQLEKEQDNGK